MRIDYVANDGTVFHDKNECEKYEYNLIYKNTQARWFTINGVPCNPGDAELVFLPDKKAWEDFCWLADYEGCYYPDEEGNWVWEYGRFVPLPVYINKLKDKIQKIEDLANYRETTSTIHGHQVSLCND